MVGRQLQKDGEETVRRLEQAGYRVVSRLAIRGYLMLAPDGVEVDVILGKYPWLDEALSHPQQDAAGYPVIGLPYLVMMKMSVQRTRDMGDLGMLLGWPQTKPWAKSALWYKNMLPKTWKTWRP